MNQHFSIPVFKAVFDEEEFDSGVKAVSFVNSPAIEVDGIALAKDKEQFKFASLEKEQAFLAPVLIPDKKIYRETVIGDPYYIVFEKDVVKKLAYKFMKEKLTDVTNVEHNSSTVNNKSYMVESFLITNELMQKALVEMGLEELPLGSWIAKYKVTDAETYNLLASNKLKGLSVEAFIGMELNKINKIKTKSDMKKENKFKSILQELKSLLMEVDLASYVLEDGSIIETAEDGTVTNPADIADGEYKTSDGGSIVVVGKKVTEVKPAAPEAPNVDVEVEVPMATGATAAPSGSTAPAVPAEQPKPEEAKKKEKMMEVKKTDGTVLFIDEETLQVSIVAEDGSYSPAPAGEHELEDGTIIVVDDQGKLVEKMSKSVKEKMNTLTKTIADLHNEVQELKTKLSSTPAIASPIVPKKNERQVDLSKLTVAQRAALAALDRKKNPLV